MGAVINCADNTGKIVEKRRFFLHVYNLKNSSAMHEYTDVSSHMCDGSALYVFSHRLNIFLVLH